MELDGVRYVAAAYALTFATLLLWLAIMGAKVRRIDQAGGGRQAGAGEGAPLDAAARGEAGQEAKAAPHA